MWRIVLTGPESTGKTTLARQLAEYYHTLWMPEYARFYLSRLHRDYTPDDVEVIAKSQMQWEDIWAKQANHLLFCDTALIVPKVWLKFKYERHSEWINQTLQERQYDLYLLCDIDLPWNDDPLREHPDIQDRQTLFRLYQDELEQLGAKFVILKGNMETRFEQGRIAVEKLRSTHK